MQAKPCWQITIIAVLLSLVVPASRTALTIGKSARHSMPRESASDQAGSPGAAPTKLAVLVGINDYKYPDRVPPLEGSVNDVEDMLQVLTTKFEFPRENILVLKNAEATHAAIISAIRDHLIARAKRGDIVVFQFSGHGSQMKDNTGKKISGLDETIVPYDSRDPQGAVFDISGAELHPLLLQLVQQTPNVTFILDSCHSGTLIRGARVRSIPPDTRTPPPLPSYAVGTTRGMGQAEDTAPLRYAFIAAASSKESAYEHVSEGEEHGVLTYFLAQQLRAAKVGATYRDVMDSVIGNVTANYPEQHPQLEGAEADQHIFGDAGSMARSYVRASPLDAHRVSLLVGQVEGATIGSIYEVYAPGSKKFALPEQPIAEAQLTTVGPFSSEGNIISGGKIAPASRAVEREHRYGRAKIRIYLDRLEASPVLQSIRDALQSLKYIDVVNDPAICHIQLRQVQGKIQALAADLSTLSPPVDVANSAIVSHVVGQINSWAKYFNVLSIRNAGSRIDLQFTIKGSQTRDPMVRVGKPDMGVFEGETVIATIQNNSEKDLYIAMLDLSSDGSISVVYPAEQGAHEVLTPGSTLVRTLTTFIPKGRSRVTDILKVFASYRPIDLSPLTQGTIRVVPADSGPPDPLQQLLADSAGLTRQVAPHATTLGSWTTVQRVLVVKRKG
jgi:hypothetical protein